MANLSKIKTKQSLIIIITPLASVCMSVCMNEFKSDLSLAINAVNWIVEAAVYTVDELLLLLKLMLLLLMQKATCC